MASKLKNTAKEKLIKVEYYDRTKYSEVTSKIIGKLKYLKLLLKIALFLACSLGIAIILSFIIIYFFTDDNTFSGGRFHTLYYGKIYPFFCNPVEVNLLSHDKNSTCDTIIYSLNKEPFVDWQHPITQFVKDSPGYCITNNEQLLDSLKGMIKGSQVWAKCKLPLPNNESDILSISPYYQQYNLEEILCTPESKSCKLKYKFKSNGDFTIVRQIANTNFTGCYNVCSLEFGVYRYLWAMQNNSIIQQCELKKEKIKCTLSSSSLLGSYYVFVQFGRDINYNSNTPCIYTIECKNNYIGVTIIIIGTIFILIALYLLILVCMRFLRKCYNKIK